MRKNRLSSLEKLFWAVFISALPVIIALRSHHLKDLLEPVNGFYAGRDWTVSALGVIFAALTCFFAGAGYFSRGSGQNIMYKPDDVKSRAVAIISLFLAVCLFADAVSCISLARDSYNASAEIISNSDSEKYGKFTLLMKTGILPGFMEGIMAIPSSLFMLIFGIDSWQGNGKAAGRRLLALCPAIWLVMRTIFRFTRTLSFLSVSELFYELLVLAFMLIFFMTFAQLYSGVNAGGNNGWILTGFGFPAAAAALMCFFSRFIMIVTGNGNKLTELAPIEPIELMLGLFVLSVIWVRVKTGAKQEQQESLD